MTSQSSASGPQGTAGGGTHVAFVEEGVEHVLFGQAARRRRPADDELKTRIRFQPPTARLALKLRRKQTISTRYNNNNNNNSTDDDSVLDEIPKWSIGRLWNEGNAQKGDSRRNPEAASCGIDVRRLRNRPLQCRRLRSNGAAPPSISIADVDPSMATVP